MRRPKRSLAAAVAALGLLLGTAAPAAARASALDRARAQATAVATQWARAQSRLSRLQSEVRSLRARRAQNQERLAGLQGALKAAAIDQFVKGRAVRPAIDVEVDASAKARASAIAHFVTVDARDAVDQYRTLAADLERESRELSARQRQSNSTVADLRRRVNQIQAVLDRLEQLDAARRVRESATRRSRSRHSGSSRTGRFRAVGDWMCPVQGPRAFGNDFGAPRGGGRRRHQGNDILARRGTPVVAPVTGSVRRHDNRLGGISFYLNGVDGIEYYGAHLSAYAGRSGRVLQGTVIGYVGNTGDARGGPPHLHFEMHPGGGRAVNPYPTLRVYC
ncbi:MAG: peptidoglycan DD-metalloendopeptidase family protein [Acidobacteria bacterium]|nr:peptidoglycan DD-metalloendopeptidase family protein [Acidobacteriota bacterium]